MKDRLMGLPVRKNALTIRDWGLLAYDLSLERQFQAVEKRIAGRIDDRLHFAEHLPVVTLGRSGGYTDLRISERALSIKGGQLCFTDRGGKATYHGPGQLVVYPIIKLQQQDVRLYVDTLLGVTADVLRAFGLQPVRKTGQPGLWVNGAKIASIGIAVKRWVAYHGVALNVRPDLQAFNWIVPCGQPDELVTSMEKVLGRKVSMERVKAVFSQQFNRAFGYPMARYVSPAEFDEWSETARKLGFSEVASGPLVRSSYHADDHFIAQQTKNRCLYETR